MFLSTRKETRWESDSEAIYFVSSRTLNLNSIISVDQAVVMPCGARCCSTLIRRVLLCKFDERTSVWHFVAISKLSLGFSQFNNHRSVAPGLVIDRFKCYGACVL